MRYRILLSWHRRRLAISEWWYLRGHCPHEHSVRDEVGHRRCELCGALDLGNGFGLGWPSGDWP